MSKKIIKWSCIGICVICALALLFLFVSSEAFQTLIHHKQLAIKNLNEIGPKVAPIVREKVINFGTYKKEH